MLVIKERQFDILRLISKRVFFWFIVFSITTNQVNLCSFAYGNAQPIFFPYQECVVLSNTHVKRVPNSPKVAQPYIHLQAKIQRCLTGHYNAGEILNIRIPDPPQDLFPQRFIEGTIKQELVIAFNHRQSEKIRTDREEVVGSAGAPFPYQSFSKSDLQTLQNGLRAPYPYSAALRLSVIDVIEEPDSAKFVITTNVEKVLFGQFSKIGRQKFAIRDAKIASHVKREMNHKAFLWEFKDWEHDLKIEEAICPVDLKSTALGQSDVDRLALERKMAKIQASSKLQQEKMRIFLRETWTPRRIMEYCRPETQRIPSYPTLQKSPYSWEGELYSNRECSLGKVTWLAHLSDGVPLYCCIQVLGTSGTVWNLGTFGDQFHYRRFSDDDFLKARIARTLGLSMVLFRRANKLPSFSSYPRYDWDTLAALADAKLIRDSRNKIIRYETLTNSGTKIEATLNKNAEISEVKIAGKRSIDWENALKDFVSNLKVLK